MQQFGKVFAATFLIAAIFMQSSGAQAQCAPGTPTCQQPSPTRTDGSSGGDGVGVQVDIGDAVKAIGSIFKKQNKPVVQPTEVVTAPVEQPKQEVVFVRSDPVVQVLPRTTTPKVTAVARPKSQPVVRKIVAPVAAATAVVEPMFDPEVTAEIPLPEPVPVAAVVQSAAPVAKAATVIPVDEPATPADNLYWMIAAAIAALVAAGTAAKFILTPKVAMDCNIADGTSRMVSNPTLSKPEVSFNVVIPGIAASPPDNFRIAT